ncbi:DNA cytosine methyltransferase [Enterobacter asburiae]|uniref:DNA cytosine methyltransferase n=1 Tax=Enterobacter asburiae TaxID=61645 RepID=UPI0020759B72|nr:DNA (cytosine-5-)-methyltransferase [Enterobacter asburiae]MCM7773474.1 DNA cytosine methyltransferase [Enterobacter asburiae]
MEIHSNITKGEVSSFRFVDLFAGIGGFHAGMAENGGNCVFACEIDENLREIYRNNFGIYPEGDIRQVDEKCVPSHDILCAGFPCQPFSLAGKKKGQTCPESGQLIDEVVRIARYHNPRYVLLENVPNIITIDNGGFWRYMNDRFNSIGYSLHHRVLSPVDIGVPQNRQRVFIVACRDEADTHTLNWPEQVSHCERLENILDQEGTFKTLEPAKVSLLAHWQQLLYKLNISGLQAVSITAPEFGANYPKDFSRLPLKELRKYSGAYGQSLQGCKTWADALSKLPSYVRKHRQVPYWLSDSVDFSRKLYAENRAVADTWIVDLPRHNNSWQILEWRGQHTDLTINNHLIQFRASGIRVFRKDVAPSLISMTPTQVPVIPWLGRYISVREAAKLQNLHHLTSLPDNNSAAFRAFGNAVNARIVSMVVSNLIKH